VSRPQRRREKHPVSDYLMLFFAALGLVCCALGAFFLTHATYNHDWWECKRGLAFFFYAWLCKNACDRFAKMSPPS